MWLDCESLRPIERKGVDKAKRTKDTPAVPLSLPPSFGGGEMVQTAQ